MGNFDDLIPPKRAGAFDDLIPKKSGGNFDDLIPKKKTAPAYGGKQGLIRFGLGGPSGYFSASGSEDVLPLVGQTVGSSVGGYGGSVAGATAGQGARQAIKSIRGTRDSQPRKIFGVGPQAPGIINDLAGEAAGTAAMEGVFRGGEKIARKALPLASNKMMTSLLRPERSVLEKNPNWGNDVLRNKIKGSFGQMAKKAKDVRDFAETEVQNIIKGSNKKITTNSLVSELSPIIKRKRMVGDAVARGDVRDVIDVARSVKRKGPEISLEEANAMKRAYYGELPKNTFKPDVRLSGATQESREKITEGLLKQMDKAEPLLKPVNKSYKTAIEAGKAIREAEANQLKWRYLPFFETAGAVGGALTGNPWLTAAILARRAAMSPYGTSTIADGLRKLGQGQYLPAIRKFGAGASAELLRKN